MLFASRVEITNIRRVAVCAGTGTERIGQVKRADLDLQLCLEIFGFKSLFFLFLYLLMKLVSYMEGVVSENNRVSL